MQDGQEPAARTYPWWFFLGAFAIVVAGVLFFFQTRDPMLLFFGLIAAGMFWLVVHLSRSGAGSGVFVRCGSCRSLNPEAARFCNQCGKGL